ncbi:MAG: oligosaccharide flippase family protein [Oscillospiraceae bacterium]|nr:oligosaccharide flippase family protein [Oscillospiraceae bacterium]
MTESKNLRLGVVFSYINIAASLIVSLLYTPFLLGSLGQQQYGLYNMGQAAVSYLGLAEFGFGNAVVRYSAKYRAEGNDEKTAGLYGVFMYIYGFLALLILTLGMLLIAFVDRFYTVSTGDEGYRQLRIIMLIMVINLSFSFFATPFSAIITAHERFTFAKVNNLIYTLLKPLVMIPLLLWGYKAITMSLVTLILTVFMHCANIIYAKRRLHIRINLNRRELDFGIVKEIIGYSFFIFLGTIVGQLNDYADSVILGVISGEIAVAVYSVGYILNTYMQQIPTTVSSVFFPRVTKQITAGASMEEMSELMIRIGRIQFYLAFLVCSGFALFGREFIYLWTGSDYAAAYWIVLVLAIPAVIPNIQVIPVLVIQAQNKHQFKAILYVVCAILNVALSIPAGLKWGPIGCAACTGLTTILTKGIAINWYYTKKIHLQIGTFWKTILLLLARLICIVPTGIFLNYLIKDASWISLSGKVVVYSVLFAVYAYFACLNKEEKYLLTETINKFRRLKRI